jgi:hypothetical protein
MRSFLTLCCLLVVAGVATSAPIPKSLKKKTVSLEGRWSLASMNYNGQALNGNSGQVWAITNDELVIEDGANGVRRNNTVNYKFAPVEGEGDNCVDWTIHYNNAGNSNYVYRGRIKFTEDGFDFAFNANGRDTTRPDSVEAGTNRYFYTFKKAEK